MEEKVLVIYDSEVAPEAINNARFFFAGKRLRAVKAALAVG